MPPPGTPYRGGPYPAGYPAPPPATARGGRTLTIGLIVVGALALLCCAGAGVGGFFVYRAVQSTRPVVDATNAFLDDLESGNYGGAYRRLCPEVQGSISEQQ